MDLSIRKKKQIVTNIAEISYFVKFGATTGLIMSIGFVFIYFFKEGSEFLSYWLDLSMR